MCNSILCHIIKLPHICLYPDDSARQLFFFSTTFHILREIFLFVKVFLSFLYEFCMNLFSFLYRFCNIFHYPVFIFALSKIFLFLYCCFFYPFVFWRIYSFTMVGSCSIAGIIFSTRSFVLSLRLDVLMHG